MFESESILLALALAADATAVCIAWSLAHAGDWRSGRALPWAFGIAQAAMAAAGFLVGAAAIGSLSTVCTWVAVAALGAIGLKMLWPKGEKRDLARADDRSGVSDSSGPGSRRRAESSTSVTSAAQDSEVSPSNEEPPCIGVDPATLHKRATLAVVVTLAVATSLDALAAGVGLPGITESPEWALVWIGFASLLLPTIGLVLGVRLGNRFGCWGERVGGAVLILLAVKTGVGV